MERLDCFFERYNELSLADNYTLLTLEQQSVLSRAEARATQISKKQS